MFIAERQESLKTMYHEQEPANKRSRLESDQAEESKRLVKNVWARSQSEIVETNFQWVIENFSFQSHEIEERILSPEFSLASNGKLKFRLELLPKGNRDVNGFITVNLMRINSSECTSPPVSIKAEISLLNGQQEILQSHCSPLAKLNGGQNIRFVMLQLVSVLKEGKLLPTDELHIHCKVEYEIKKTTITGSIPQISQQSSSNGNLSDRFGHLMFHGNQSFSDVQIRVRGTTIDAHKFVLAAGSPVLQIMFQSECFIESRNNIVQIDDLDPPVVNEMLRYLYTDQVPKMDEMAKELFVAADKYMIDLLKSKCEVVLAQTLAIENCCELLALADSYSAPELKKVALDFIVFNAAEVAKTEGWQVMKSNQPQLCFKVSEILMAQTRKIEEPKTAFVTTEESSSRSRTNVEPSPSFSSAFRTPSPWISPSVGFLDPLDTSPSSPTDNNRGGAVFTYRQPTAVHVPRPIPLSSLTSQHRPSASGRSAAHL